jgi:hypothetical protein
MEKEEFVGFKTHTSFYFKNKKERERYWDDLLIESVVKYKDEFSKYLHELTHVYLSLGTIFKYFMYGALILTWIAFFNHNVLLMMINGSLTIIFTALSAVYLFKCRSQILKTMLSDELNSIEFLEKLRDFIIKDKNKT